MKCPDDENLIRFLKTHQPQPPLASEDSEAALMALLGTQSNVVATVQSHRKSKVIWLGIPTAIAAGLTLAWGQFKPIQTPEIAEQTTPSPAALISVESPPGSKIADEELATFLETSWSNGLSNEAFYTESHEYGYVEMLGTSEP
ncbi:MAG: hypothetical protein WBB82_07655 [Limnothrix sp.]